MNGDTDIESCAARLHEAWRTATAIAPLTDTLTLTQADAYAIQAALLARRGGRSAGYKLGFTSAAMRAQMKVDTPNYGVLLAGTQISDGALPGGLIHPRVEPEIALVLGRELAGPEVHPAQAEFAVDAVCAAIEVVDSRYHDYRFRPADNIADNSSAAHFCLGPLRPARSVEDLRLIGVLLSGTTGVLDQGLGVAAMGSPYAALAWLANRLAAEGRTVPAGAVVLTGGLTRAHPIAPGETLSAEFGAGLGTLVLRA